MCFSPDPTWDTAVKPCLGRAPGFSWPEPPLVSCGLVVVSAVCPSVRPSRIFAQVEKERSFAIKAGELPMSRVTRESICRWEVKIIRPIVPVRRKTATLLDWRGLQISNFADWWTATTHITHSVEVNGVKVTVYVIFFEHAYLRPSRKLYFKEQETKKLAESFPVSVVTSECG